MSRILPILLFLAALCSPIASGIQVTRPTPSDNSAIQGKASPSEIADLQKKADSGNADAQNRLGVLYWMGDGVNRDRTQAVQWYRKAARQGNADAMFNLGAAYYDGEGVATIDDILAYAWFVLAGQAGSTSGADAAKRSQSEHPHAYDDVCFAIGQLYERGEDLPKNIELASAWYRKAAQQGHVQAILGLATLAINAKDFGVARDWCERAAKERAAGGYYCLAYLNQHGLGGDQNLKAALKWYQDAAKMGNQAAMITLGKMFAGGEGVKRDRAQAFLWYFTAARRGNAEAISAANDLRASMSEKERKEPKRN